MANFLITSALNRQYSHIHCTIIQATWLASWRVKVVNWLWLIWLQNYSVISSKAKFTINHSTSITYKACFLLGKPHSLCVTIWPKRCCSQSCRTAALITSWLQHMLKCLCATSIQLDISHHILVRIFLFWQKLAGKKKKIEIKLPFHNT